jgi:outer membrane lipoprotein SlyB
MTSTQTSAKRKPARIVQLGIAGLALTTLAACVAPQSRPVAYPSQTSYPAASYPAQNAPGAYAETGRVTRVEVLQGQPQEAPRASGLGAVLGGVAGAVVGRQIGGGTGRDVATVAGAVGGAVAGNAIERNRNSGNAATAESYRISIQMDNGTARAYDVPAHGDLRVGDRVRVENGQISRM